MVDDEPSIRQLVTNSLARAGYRVDSAADGALAWEALQVRRYDLLITDNTMPRINGIALVKKLRSKSSTLPVVMATGRVPEELESQLSLRISDILLKPFTMEEILKIVKKVLCEAGSTGTTSNQPADCPSNTNMKNNNNIHNLIFVPAGHTTVEPCQPSDVINADLETSSGRRRRPSAMTISVHGKCDYSEDGVTFTKLEHGHSVEQGAIIRTGENARTDLFSGALEPPSASRPARK